MAFLNKLFGKKDKGEQEKELVAEKIELDGDSDELTDEEIEAAERFEAENRDDFINTTPLDCDGEFIDFESLIDDEEYEQEDDEDGDLEELDDDEDALDDVEKLYGGEAQVEEDEDEE